MILQGLEKLEDFWAFQGVAATLKLTFHLVEMACIGAK